MAPVEMVALLLTTTGIVMAASGRWQGMAEPESDRPLLTLPKTAEEIESVKFSIGVRGYRMDEVDAVLAACAQALRESEKR